MFHPAIKITALSLTLSGCAVQNQIPPHAPPDLPTYVTPDLYARATPATTAESDTARTSRYRLTRTTPTADQQDLLAQIIEVSVPTRFNPTVGDAIRHSLTRTGYSLCAANTQNNTLFSRDLPAAHYMIGPMRLRDALQILGGQAWRVDVDEVSRKICYSLRPGYPLPGKVAASTSAKEAIR